MTATPIPRPDVGFFSITFGKRVRGRIVDARSLLQALQQRVVRFEDPARGLVIDLQIVGAGARQLECEVVMAFMDRRGQPLRAWE